MSRVKDIMEGRNQGLAFALKVARAGGVEALEKEIQSRNISGISLNVPCKEVEVATDSMRLRATEVAIAISLVTLVDEFCFSKMQARKFKAVFDAKVDSILTNEATLEDYLYRIHQELKIELVVKE